MAYSNGRLPARALAEIKSHKKHYITTRKAQPKAAEAFDRLDAAFYKKFGKHIYITDSYRSYEEQVTPNATARTARCSGCCPSPTTGSPSRTSSLPSPSTCALRSSQR